MLRIDRIVGVKEWRRLLSFFFVGVFVSYSLWR